MTSSLARFSELSFGHHLAQTPEAELMEAALEVSSVILLGEN
jgi:hypothetical protein